MWLKVDDEFPEHEKVLLAAAALSGEKPIGRVLSVWLEAGCYAARRLTDGFVPTRAFVDSRADVDALAVARAMVGSKLLLEVDGGFRFHDWSEYQPSAEKLKKKRKRERDKKRKQRVGTRRSDERAETAPGMALLEGHVEDKNGDARGDNSGDICGDTEAPQARRNCAETALAGARVPVPDPDPLSKAEEQRVPRRVRPVTMALDIWEVRKHLLAAVHRLLEHGAPYVNGDGPAEVVNLTELREDVKLIAARHLGAVWSSARELDAIIDSALARRRQIVEAAGARARFERREAAGLRRLGAVR